MATRKSNRKAVKNEQLGEVGIARMLLNSSLFSGIRRNLQGFLGYSYGGDRDIYTSLGWPREIRFKDYLARYTRQGLARRVVDAYPNATWRLPPDVFEEMDSEITTPFEEAWRMMIRNRNIRFFNNIRRIDRMSGVGSYGVLFLGFDDAGKTAEPFKNPVKRGSRLVYLQPYFENSVEIKEYEDNPADPRFGLPKIYRLNPEINGMEMEKGRPISRPQFMLPSQDVHWTRVIHVADNTDDSPLFGKPRMEPVFNDLMAIELVVGGASEAFWKFGFPGISFENLPDTEIDYTDEEKSALQSEIEDYMHGTQRYLRLQNIAAKVLNHGFSDPKATVEVLLGDVSSGTGIPTRVLMGSESGSLASTQDRENWWDRVDERKAHHCDDLMRDIIDRLILIGALPEPDRGDYEVKWPDTRALDEKSRAELTEKLVGSLCDYARTTEARYVMPPEMFLRDVWGYDERQIQEAREHLGGDFLNIEDMVADAVATEGIEDGFQQVNP